MTTEIYAVLRLRSWEDFEPAPGSWAPFPVGIKGEGIGFLVVYDTEEEAIAAAEGCAVLPLTVTKRSGGDSGTYGRSRGNSEGI